MRSRVDGKGRVVGLIFALGVRGKIDGLGKGRPETCRLRVPLLETTRTRLNVRGVKRPAERRSRDVMLGDKILGVTPVVGC